MGQTRGKDGGTRGGIHAGRDVKMTAGGDIVVGDKITKTSVLSADGKLALTASDDGTARVWDIATGKQLHVLRGHEDYINSAILSADGKLIATASDDTTVRIWDAST